MLCVSNPRMFMRESPAPPPCIVEKTEGVEFKTKGISWEPRLNSMSFLSIFVNATGVSLSFALSDKTVTDREY